MATRTSSPPASRSTGSRKPSGSSGRARSGAGKGSTRKPAAKSAAKGRAPAKGLWSEDGDNHNKVVRDDIAVYEVMADALDRPWWADYRATLAQRFEQQELVIRAHPVEVL